MTTTGKELARPEDLRAATETIRRALHAGDGRAADTAMALYVPKTQALIVRTAFVDAMARRPGESQADALSRAGREAERVLDTVPTNSAREVVGELDHQVVGAMLSAAAGEPSSTAAHLVDPKRIEDLLASDLELWTREAPGEEEHPASKGTRKSTINVQHLVHVLWTILQTDENRASAFLRRLNPDLVAYPLALELLRPSGGQEPWEAQEEAANAAGDLATGDYFASLRTAAAEGPDSLGLGDRQLVQLLEEIHQLSPETYRAVVYRAQSMDLHEVREQLMLEAADRASGGDEAPAGATGDDMFKSLDPPK